MNRIELLGRVREIVQQVWVGGAGLAVKATPQKDYELRIADQRKQGAVVFTVLVSREGILGELVPRIQIGDEVWVTGEIDREGRIRAAYLRVCKGAEPRAEK